MAPGPMLKLVRWILTLRPPLWTKKNCLLADYWYGADDTDKGIILGRFPGLLLSRRYSNDSSGRKSIFSKHFLIFEFPIPYFSRFKLSMCGGDT